MKDYHTLLKQLSIKGDKPFGKNKMEIMQQLCKRINQLKTYLRISIFTAIKEHTLPTSNAAPNTIHVLQPFCNEEVMQPFHTL
jgi:hypothetical protein